MLPLRLPLLPPPPVIRRARCRWGCRCRCRAKCLECRLECRGYASAVMSAMQMPGPYGTSQFGAMPGPGNTGMMMLPQGGLMPGQGMGMFPGQVAQPAKNALLKTSHRRRRRDCRRGAGAGHQVCPGAWQGHGHREHRAARAATIYVDGAEHGRADANAAYVIRDLPRGKHLMLVRAEDGEAQQP